MNMITWSTMLFEARKLLAYLENGGLPLALVQKIEKCGAGDAEWWEVTAVYETPDKWAHEGVWQGRDIAHALNRMRRNKCKPDKVLQRRMHRRVA